MAALDNVPDRDRFLAWLGSFERSFPDENPSYCEDDVIRMMEQRRRPLTLDQACARLWNAAEARARAYEHGTGATRRSPR